MIKFRAKRVNGGEWVFTPLWYVSDRCEVIGNAFDNPELMKEGVQPFLYHIFSFSRPKDVPYHHYMAYSWLDSFFHQFRIIKSIYI